MSPGSNQCQPLLARGYLTQGRTYTWSQAKTVSDVPRKWPMSASPSPGYLSQGRIYTWSQAKTVSDVPREWPMSGSPSPGYLSQGRIYTWSQAKNVSDVPREQPMLMPLLAQVACPKGGSIPGAKQRPCLMSPGSSQCQPLLSRGHLSQGRIYTWSQAKTVSDVPREQPMSASPIPRPPVPREDLYLEPSKDRV